MELVLLKKIGKNSNRGVSIVKKLKFKKLIFDL